MPAGRKLSVYERVVTGRVRALPYSYRVRSGTKKGAPGKRVRPWGYLAVI